MYVKGTMESCEYFCIEKTIGEFSFYKRERIGFKRVQKETGSEFRNLFLFLLYVGYGFFSFPNNLL